MKMTIKEFQLVAEYLMSPIQELIGDMPQKGDTPNECQKMNLQRCLSDLGYAFNGTEQKDLEND